MALFFLYSSCLIKKVGTSDVIGLVRRKTSHQKISQSGLLNVLNESSSPLPTAGFLWGSWMGVSCI